MTAMRNPEPVAPEQSPRPASTRRPGAARRAPGAAGQQRRSLERSLAAREASLRISRRVSGPAGGLSRPQAPAPEPPAPRTSAIPADRPAAVVAAAAPAVRPRPAVSAPRVAAPVRSVTPAARPSMRHQARVTPAARVVPQAARSAAAPMPAPSIAPARRPMRPLVVLPGGAQGESARRTRLSTPAVVVTAVLAVVLTVGVIVAAQIRVTQMNEQIGHDLATTTKLEQSTVSRREQISSLVTSARIDDEVARKQLIEPDPQDIRYVSAGGESTAERAARALRAMPVTPTGATAP